MHNLQSHPARSVGDSTGVRCGHEMVSGSRVDSAEDVLLWVTVNELVTETETDAKSVSFVHGEWVCKGDRSVRAMVDGVNMYIRFILCYISSIVAPHISFAFSFVDIVGYLVVPLHP